MPGPYIEMETKLVHNAQHRLQTRLVGGRCSWINIMYVILTIIIHQIFSLVQNWSKRIILANIPQLKLGNVREYSPSFKTMCVEKTIWRIINTIASIWGINMLGYLSLDIFICSSYMWLTVLLKLRSWKTVHYSEQIMSADKYPSIFSHQMEAIVYICSIHSWGWTGTNLQSRVTTMEYYKLQQLVSFAFETISLHSAAR